VQNAVEAYEKLYEVSPRDEEANTKLKELYGKRRAYKPLYDLLKGESERTEGEARLAVMMEMAKIAAERLDRGADAVALYRKVLEEDPASMPALDALEKQAERDKDFATVAEALEKRVDLAPDPESELAILQKLGAIYTDRIANNEGAVRTYKRVLTIAPGHPKALRVLRDTFLTSGNFDELRDLYAKNNDWDGLAEVLSTAADRATDPEQKVQLSYRAAEVYVDHLQSPERAFRAYERVLGVKPDDRRAAAALIPIYEKDEKWARLPALYEVLLSHADDNDEKRALYKKLVDVTGTQLQDPARALEYARKAYEVEPDAEGALEAFEASARAGNGFAQFVAALEARLATAKKIRKEERRRLQSKIAQISAKELGLVDEAVAAYKKLVEDEEVDEGTVETLHTILREANRADDLRWLYELRIGRAQTAQQVQLLSDWAALEEQALGSPEKAIAIYQRLLEIVPQHGAALRAVARMLRATGDAAGAARALETDRDQREGEERAHREVELARLYAGPLARSVDALAAAKRALDTLPGDPGAVEVVELLLQVPETRGKAAEILEKIYGDLGAPARQVEVLNVMIATAASKGDRVDLYVRLAEVLEQKLRDPRGAFDVIARAAGEFPAELSLWDRLSILANRTQRAQAFVDAIAEAVPPTGESGLPHAVELDLVERAATLYEEMLGEPQRAQPYLERILAREPANERAFMRLKQILTTLERWSDLEGFYERAVAAATTGSRRADLLGEAAIIAEDIIGDPAKATTYHERILEIDPTREQTIRSLEGLYASLERWQNLAKLLQSRLERASGEDAVKLKFRLGSLCFTRLNDPASALRYLEAAVEAEPTNREARDMLDKSLAIPELRARAAVALEGAFVATDAVRDLVRVLEIRLESAKNDDERRELLQRIADLRDDRLNEGALDVYARLVPLSPEDGHARARLLELARKVGAYEEAVRVLAQAAEAATPAARAEILGDLARVYEQSLNDSKRAEEVYRQLIAIDPEDAGVVLPAARALARILSASGRNGELAQMLKLQTKLETDAMVRRDLLAQLGDLADKTLDDPKAAIEAWKSRAEDDPDDEAALAALDRLYERTGDFRALVDVLRSRERQSQNADDRKILLTRIAVTLAEKIGDAPEAILAYRAIVDDFGAERAPLAALARLYEAASNWPELVETLEAELGLAESATDRLHLLSRIAGVKEAKQGDLQGALEGYREALALDPSHLASRAALEALLTNVDARREAAAILRPLYETGAEETRLLRVIDIEAEYADTADEKIALFAQASRVAEEALHDAPRAFAYASRAMKESVSEPELPKWIETTERLAAITSGWSELVELYRSLTPEVTDGEVQIELTLKVAEIARTRLGDATLAKESYVKALELNGDETRALVALEQLYEEAKEYPALLDILKKRADAAETDADRKKILAKEARLSDETLHDAPAAAAVYEQILEIGEDDDAFRALERLYTTLERWDDLIALFERQLGTDVASGKKADLHHRLGVVFEKRVNDVDRAFDQYEAALALDSQHAAVISSLEGLLEEPEHALRSAEVLEAVYLARSDWSRVMTAIEARLKASEDPDERRALLRRLAKLREEQKEDYRGALDTTAQLLAEDLTDEATWAELERLARVANATDRLAEIFATELDKVTSDESATARLSKRTGELFEAKGDVEKALHYFRRAYTFAPDEDAAAFEAIDRLLKANNRAKDRATLYREALEYRDDPVLRLATLQTIATIEEVDLKDDDAAIETYKSALEVEETDAPSLAALSRLYSRRERWSDLADLIRRRAEQSALPEEEAKHRYELGALLQTRLSDVGGAIDEYQNVVESAPLESEPLRQAVNALEILLQNAEHKARVVDILRPIYERADDWRHIVGVNVERLALATDDGEKVSIYRENARLWEERGKDLTRAFDAVEKAFALDPDDGDTRGELDRLGDLTKSWDALAAAYEHGIERADDLNKRELLVSLAKLHDEKRDDPRSALKAYERLAALDETDPDPLDKIDRLAVLLADWPTLVRVLAKRSEQMGDEDRASAWRRIGEVERDMLDNAGEAITAYERALEIEPESTFTVDSLISLHDAKNDVPRLVELYKRRIELTTGDSQEDADLKHQLLLEAANRYETSLSDPREAISLLGDALAARPGDEEVMRRLERLYAAEKMWSELQDSLRERASRATTDADRSEIKKKIGALLAKELDDPRAALDAYREVLTIGFDSEAATAVRQIGETHEELRLEVVDTLEPVLRAADKNEDLVELLDMRLRAQTDPHDRARTLRDIAEVAERKIHDAKRAERTLLRALVETPDDAPLHEEIERVAEIVGRDGWELYADALSDRSAAIFDATVSADLQMRLGKVAEDRLNADARASKAFVTAAEQAGDNETVLAALDRLFLRLREWTALADILERRVSIEAGADAQAELYYRLATLQIEQFSEPQKGLGTLRLAVERVPDHASSREALEKLLDANASAGNALYEEAFEALEGVYRSASRADDLARLYERRISRANGAREQIRARLQLARVLEEEGKDPSRAQKAIEQAVAVDPSDADVLAELERLAPVNSAWAQAADSLASALAGEGGKSLTSGTRAELWVRLAGWRREKLQDSRGSEDALLKALDAEPENVAILRDIEDLRRTSGRERDLVATLRARAALEPELQSKRDLLREAKEIAQTALSDSELAEAVLRDLLAVDDGDRWALEELTKIREAAADHHEVARLLLRRADLADDGAEVSTLKHRAATLYAETLGSKDRAVELYEMLFENDGEDAVAATKLRELYADLGKRDELVKLLETLIDRATSAEDRASLRINLARLQGERGKADEAIAALRAIVDEDEKHVEAVLALSDLLEKTGAFGDLAALLETRITHARDAASADLTGLEMKLAKLFEEKIEDRARALSTYEAVLAHEPNHAGALEAVARLTEANGDNAKAADVLARLLDAQTNGDGASIALRLAAARGRLGDDAGVETALLRAIEIDAANAQARSELRALYERTKKWKELADLLASDADLIEKAHPDEVKPQETTPSIPPPAGKPVGRASLTPPPPAPAPTGPVADVLNLLRRAAEIHLRERKAPADAVPVLERARLFAPNDRELLLLLCDAYTASGRERDATAVLEKIIQSFGGKRTKELSVYHHRLGKALAQLGDKDVALTQLDLAFKIDPGSVAVLKDLGVLALETNDLDRAQKTFRALLLQKLDSASGISKGEVFFYLGEISAKQGDKTKAVQMLERAIENEPTLERAKARLSELKG
jgi:tetratricopeptide (TPR) repeat protein